MAPTLLRGEPHSMNDICIGAMLTRLTYQFLMYDRIISRLGIRPSSFCVQKRLFDWRFTDVDVLNIPKLTLTASSRPVLCQYYLFSTWLTCNLNSLNSNDNRLLRMGSHCIRGQGETDCLCALPMKFRTRANQGGRKRTPLQISSSQASWIYLKLINFAQGSNWNQLEGSRSRGAACEKWQYDLQGEPCDAAERMTGREGGREGRGRERWSISIRRGTL